MKKIELDKIPPITSSNFSNSVGKTEPTLESVIEDQKYAMDKLKVENASLPDNVVEVQPPSKFNTTIVNNFFINPNNVSRIAGIQANDSCIVSEIRGDHRLTLDACNPPDVQIAPGKEQVIEMTNNFVGVWNKSDIVLNKTILGGSNLKNPIYWTNDFFRIDRKNDTFDPSITYDPYSHRWFSTVIEFEIPGTLDESRKYEKMGVILAYSAPDNYKKWTIMKLPPRLKELDQTTYYCPDRPMIYSSTDKVLISMTASDAEDKFCSERSGTSRFLFMTVFNKTQLLDDSLSKKPYKVIYIHWRNFHYVPVISNIDNPDINLVNIPPVGDDNFRLTYLKINGTLDSLSCHLYERDLTYQKYLPPNAVQKGTNHRILLADNRIINAISPDGNETWITFHQACKKGEPNTSCIRIVKFTVEGSPISESCRSRGATNSTNTVYEGGNATTPNELNETQIVSMVEAAELPSGTERNVISALISDPKTVSGVASVIGSELNTTVKADLNTTNGGNLTSGIVSMVKAAELPRGTERNVISALISDPKTVSRVASEVRSHLVSEVMIKRDLDFQVGSKNYYYFYPSIALSKQGELVAYFGFSSKDNYPSLGLFVMNTTSLYQNGSNVKGVLYYDPILVKNGTAYAQEETINDTAYCYPEAPCTRYGDYFSIRNDPFDDSLLWAAGEYYDGKYFSTVISSIRLR